MVFCVLIEYHPMAGLDYHFDLIPSVPPIPTPFEPHAVAAMLNWVLPSSFSPTVLALYGRVMQRGTDIMSFIPHIPIGPGILLSPMETLFSGSKSYFGPASVQVVGKEPGGKPIAVAILGILNLNLNCGTIPTPTGMVVAPNTVVAGMTLGDFLGGLFAMIVDCAMQTAVNLICAPLTPMAGGIAGLFIGGPLGWSLNANGSGPVNHVGRMMGAFSDFVRGAGETIGGDREQGRADQEQAIHAAAREFERPLNPNNPFSGWNVRDDAGRIFQPPPPLRPFTSGALRNPLAEQF